MDTDPCGSDGFYDENASFLPQLDDYSLEDIDEILRVTNSHLDSSLNFSALNVEHGLQQAQQSPQQTNDFNVNFDYAVAPADASADYAGSTPQYDSSQSQRTSSVSSTDGEHFNPDELMKFFNDDDVKMEEFSSETVLNMPQRNTPSPTGSCSSSGGSSTSGIQSDVSSVASMPQSPRSKLSTYFVDQQDINSIENGNGFVELSAPATNETKLFNISPATPTQMSAIVAAPAAAAAASATTTTTPVSIPVPILPVPVQSSSSQANTHIPTATLIQPINMVQGTIIPIKTVPLVNVKSTVPATIVPTATLTPANIKIEPKIAPKIINATTQQPFKLITPTAAGVNANVNANANTNKITPPPNTKPKTIYLSTNDFKALMQKMNTNGTTNKCIKPGATTIAGQLPKIIMKTPNGKVITANKIMHPFSGSGAGGGNTVPHNLMSKIVKANAPLVIKQQQQQHGKASVNFATADSGHSGVKSHGHGISVYKGIIDEKMSKKQQRMIKNRESASLSRKKKKEYVVSLETRINNLEKENYTLKGENTSLRSQLVAFAQTCHCKHSNVSEFILNSLNASAKVNQPGGIGVCGEHQHVKIAPKPSPKSLKQRMSAANVRKNMAVLFAMAFMVTLNVGNFQTYFNNNAIENALESAAAATAAAGAVAETEPLAGTGRRLLWVESETEFKEKLNRTKRMSELEVPPLHFLRPINRTNRIGGGGGGDGIDAAEQLRNGTAREPPPLSKCADGGGGGGAVGITANQTENMRLVNNLQKWIDGNGYLNLSSHERYGNDLDESVGFKLTPDYVEWKTMKLPVHGKQKRKYFLETPQYNNKLPKLDMIKDTDSDDDDDGDDDDDNDDDDDDEHIDAVTANAGNSLELFKPKLSDEYVRLFKGIKRQDDTFYVLSFNMEHILLPASVYNKSARPKMSLMLPAGDPSLNGDIVLMQIDCEVINTTEIELKSDMIPEKLRPLKNVNLHPTTAPNPNDVANNETRQQHQQHQQQEAKNMPTTATTTSAATTAAANLTTKEKPVAKNYIIVGPKTQATALGLKKKPTIVKFNGNVRVPNIVAMNVKNSTLFAKMRETVEADAAAGGAGGAAAP